MLTIYIKKLVKLYIVCFFKAIFIEMEEPPWLLDSADELLRTLSPIRLDGSIDMRTLPLCGKTGGKLHTSALYKLCTYGGVLVEHHEFISPQLSPVKSQVLQMARRQESHLVLEQPPPQRDPRRGRQRAPHLCGAPRDNEPHPFRLLVCAMILGFSPRDERR
jgi:hypothetical protein